jgi:hypothetical protein
MIQLSFELSPSLGRCTARGVQTLRAGGRDAGRNHGLWFKFLLKRGVIFGYLAGSRQIMGRAHVDTAQELAH